MIELDASPEDIKLLKDYIRMSEQYRVMLCQQICEKYGYDLLKKPYSHLYINHIYSSTDENSMEDVAHCMEHEMEIAYDDSIQAMKELVSS